MNTLSLDVRHVQALGQSQDHGTKLGVKSVAGKKDEEATSETVSCQFTKIGTIFLFLKKEKKNNTMDRMTH